MIHIENALNYLKNQDPVLENYFDDVRIHLNRYNSVRKLLVQERELCDISNGYMYFGFQPTETGWVFREWLPGADAVWLYGDFNNWNKVSHPLTMIGDGVWEIKFDDKNTITSL